MEKKATVNAKLLALAHDFIDKKDHRPYLRGVCIQPHHEKGVTMVGSNGQAILIVYDEHGTINCDELIVGNYKKSNEYTLTIDDSSTILKGKFPYWRNLLTEPTGGSGCISLNSNLTKRFTRVASEIERFHKRRVYMRLENAGTRSYIQFFMADTRINNIFGVIAHIGASITPLMNVFPEFL